MISYFCSGHSLCADVIPYVRAYVIPAKAGIQSMQSLVSKRGFSAPIPGFWTYVIPYVRAYVIPAFAGIQ